MNKPNANEQAGQPPAGNDRPITTSDHVIDCSPFREELLRLSSAETCHPYQEVEQFLIDSSLSGDELPVQMRQTLLNFHLHGNDQGILLFLNVPIDWPVPPTPLDPSRPRAGPTFLAERSISLVASRLRDVVGYAEEKAGTPFQNILPAPGKEKEQTSVSSKGLLEFHTETAFSPHLPDYVLLLCLRPDHEVRAETFHASIRKMLPLIPNKYHDRLFRPAFFTAVDLSFGNVAGRNGSGSWVPVLYGDRSDPFLRYDLDLMQADDPEDQAALQSVREAANTVKKSVVLRSGDLLVLDNKRCVHGRGSFVPRYDGRDRWLLRAFVVCDLSRSAEDRKPGERIIHFRPEYAQQFRRANVPFAGQNCVIDAPSKVAKRRA